MNSRKRKGQILVVSTLLLLVLSSTLNRFSNQTFNDGIERYLNPLFIIAYAFMGLRALVWVNALKNVSISSAYPVMSLSYPLILIIDYSFFEIELSIGKLIGCFTIIIGVGLLSKSKK